jgi:hypothetical protein
MPSFLTYAFRVSSNSTPIRTSKKSAKMSRRPLHRDEKSRRLPDLFSDQDPQMYGGQRHNDDRRTARVRAMNF